MVELFHILWPNDLVVGGERVGGTVDVEQRWFAVHRVYQRQRHYSGDRTPCLFGVLLQREYRGVAL